MANNAQTSTALLLTRPQDSAERFLARLNPSLLTNVSVCMSPLLQIIPNGSTPDMSRYEGVIFTSAQAVIFAPTGAGMPAYCVGAQTAKRAAIAGWSVKLVVQTAEELIAAIRAQKNTGSLVHLAGAHRRGDIAQRLGDQGISVHVVTLYDQRLLPLKVEAQTLLAEAERVIVPLFSPRTAAQFLDQAETLGQAHVIAISTAVVAVLNGATVAGVDIADEPTGADMARSVEMLLQKTSLA
ncbi:Uroporphyrinogen-III synthase [Sulfitobacter noctilucae]|uniref:uroporphyrinogen-III synthase n=1 Tax=Sulfitobacter noctilucae TaxID=1342302 RepID=UPI00046AB3EC|nr:uroporphyrinogen-III synthase [Sulfitobacter noctilucae]KIN65782.1 Uroporphyrinogen-III synthase [Sulfitobacter noctilucae]